MVDTNNDINNCKRYEIDIFDNHVVVLDKDRRILIGFYLS